MNDSQIEPLLTEPETAAIIKYKTNTLAGWRVKLAKGNKRVPNLRAVIVGGSVRYRPEFVRKFINERTSDENGIVPKHIPRRPPGSGRPQGTAHPKRKHARRAA